MGRRGSNYKILIIIGGLLGIFSVLSYYLSESLGAWWQVTFEFWSLEKNHYINAFGYSDDRQILGNLGTFAGVLFLLGSFLAIISASKESKGFGILSAFLMFAGIGLFLYALSEWEDFERLLDILEFLSGEEYNVFYGSHKGLSWGLSTGFFMGTIAALIVLLSSLKMD